MSVPCPSTSKPIKLKDRDVGYSYIEFPEDTFFMESVALNESFRSGVAYVPVQRYVNDQEESHLYEITASSMKAKHIAGPIAAPDGSIDVTIFGSALSSDGMLYLCAFNRNSIIAFDLKTLPEDGSVEKVTCTLEVDDLASPNDVCLDPQDETIMYVVGGTFRNIFPGCIEFSNSAYGKVYKIQLSQYNAVTVIADNLKTLAGVEKLNNSLYIAQLFDIVKQDTDNETMPTQVWKGNYEQDQVVWLADNICIFDNDKLICPAYSTSPISTVEHVLKRSWLFSGILFYFQIATAFTKKERLRTALRDPEISLSFSNTYIRDEVDPSPIRLIFIDTTKSNIETKHFEIDLVEKHVQIMNQEKLFLVLQVKKFLVSDIISMNKLHMLLI